MGLRIERNADPRRRRRRLWALALMPVAALLAWMLSAGGLGRLVADLWIAVMGVLTGLLGGLLGG